MKSYDLNLLTALDALLATGSVTAAAGRMNLSTPAMSHTLARIREVFGDAMLVRAGRRLVPTPRALALVEPVRALLAQAQALRMAPDAQSLESERRRFVLRAPDSTAVVFGAAFLQALQTRMPLASLQMLPEGYVDAGALRDGRMDLDVGYLRELEPELKSVVLSEHSLAGAVIEGHPLMRGVLTAKRFAAAQHVDVTPRSGAEAPVDAALAALGLRRQLALQVPSAHAALIAASRSNLVACVHSGAVKVMAASLGLQVFKPPFAVQATPVRMAWHPRFDADPAHLWLRECVQQVLDESHAMKMVPTSSVLGRHGA